MATDVGVVRPHNEDTAHVDSDRSFFIVADGMGGHAAGEVASAMAVETVRTKLESARGQLAEFAIAPSDLGRRSLVQLLQDAVLSAHQAVFQRGSTEEDKNGMGTTLDVLLICGTEAFVAHVGDSRTYLIRDGRASQLTTDHTYAEVMVIEGKLTIEEAQVSQLRNILVNAVGVSAEVGVEMAHLELRRHDRLLLCSDGLHDYFPGESEIADRLLGGDTGAGLTSLVELAKTRGGHDNITGIAIQVIDITPSGLMAVPQDETQPVSTVGLDGHASTDDEHTETTAVPSVDGLGAEGSSEAATEAATDASGDASGEGRDGSSEGADEGASATDDDKAGRKRRGSKRPAGKLEGKATPPGRALRKSRPPRDKLSTPSEAEEAALADTLPPTLVAVPAPSASPTADATGADSRRSDAKPTSS